ncbi:MAG TPA: hypothetical protein VLG12_08175, partial [Candidatus Saccharimonadales bacterium]|nr:hypothetical protein [Candidatus Saccharimonadales bacterium]
RQKIARLNDRFESESKKIDEIADALSSLLKSLKVSSVLSEDEYFKLMEYDIPIFFTVRTGAEALHELMENLDLSALIVSLRKEIEKASGQKYLKLVKRLRLIESLRKTNVSPSAMIMSVLPVIPPDLRPMVQLAGGRFATSDLNDLYRRVINRNNRLRHLILLGAPEIILRNEKRMLQESVDALIDASQRSNQVSASPLRSLSDMLRGKQGRFRQNLLGKRVDYSGRSVIIVGPELKLSECGLPKEMALGIFYLTVMDETLRKEELTLFADKNEAFMAHSLGKIKLREPLTVRIDNAGKTQTIETTIGRLMFNERLISGMSYINDSIKASGIKKLITAAIAVYSADQVADLIDSIKSLGFYGATVSGISVSVFDNVMVAGKDKMIDAAEKKVSNIDEEYQQGLITIDEKKRLANDVWMKTTEEIADLTWNNLKATSVIKTIIDSEGARAGKEQLKQLSAMRGLILDPMGKIVELPIKSNFREGLSIFEYVASARGSRKGLTDGALKTANAGYLTRRLVDASHEVIVIEEDCGATEGVLVLAKDGERVASFADRIFGRVSAEKITSKKTKKVLIEKNEEISVEKAQEIMADGVEEMTVRSPLTCKLTHGICSACYGWDFSTKKRISLGVPVGIIAAQSIGEPGTQLTMRVKHFGGIVMSDVTQGLPRVEELFEMRTPKSLSSISQINGKVKIETTDEGYKITVKNTKIKPMEAQEYFIPLAAELAVKDNDEIVAGTPFARGYLDPKEVIKVGGLFMGQRYILSEAQKVYEAQGIGINDKHFEVILRKMSDKVVVETIGDTPLIPGDFVTKSRFEEINAETLSQGGEPATGRQVILGITKAALFSDSWLSAASFQETTSVLTDAALEGREDKLLGLKENVIIGRLIPVEGLPQDQV